MILHPHQNKMVDELRALLPDKKSGILQLATGGGKTVLALHIIQGAIKKNTAITFCVHRKQLLDQTEAAFADAGIEHGFIASGKPVSDKHVNIAMLQTLQKRMDGLAPPRLLIVDEAHISSSRGAASIIDWVRSAGGYVIGLSATPKRTDGQGLRGQFDFIVQGPSMAWLIEHQFLSPYELYAPEFLPDMSKVGTANGEYIQSQAEKVLNNTAITGSAITAYKYHCDGAACILFANSVKHAYDMAAEFCAAGYKFVAIDATTSDEGRRAAIQSLSDRKIHGICNYGLCIEGLNIPLVECVIIQRATKSLIVWLQAIGRGLRFIKGKKCVILDQTGNVYRHGLPCDEREWSLDGKKKNRTADEKPMALKHCAKCKAIYGAKHMCCPRCGAVQLIAHKELEIKKGTLKAVTKEDIEAVHAARRQRKTEEWQADTYEKLVALGVKRGYDNPKYWAKLKTEIRSKRNGNKKTNG